MAAIGAALGVGARISSQPISRLAPPDVVNSRSAVVSASLQAPLPPAKEPSHSSAWRHHHLRQCVIARAVASTDAVGVGANFRESLAQCDLMRRLLELGFAWPGSGEGAVVWLVIAVPAVLWYFAAAAPGSIWGLVDYAYARLHSLSHISFDASEVQVGRQIGQGSYGVVYEGFIGRGVRKVSKRKELHVILKKVKPRTRDAPEMHNAEVYMNRRVQRTAPCSCADFLGTTIVKQSETVGRLSKGMWLVWRYEGDKTLNYYMQQKNFPQNIADILLGSSKINGRVKEDILEHSNAVIRKITAQILTALRDLHKTGVVHRDVKPLNLILAKDSCTFKLIDLGAAVDLRSGYNYVPDETIMDPAYTAPERHVMPIFTPKLPPDPLCSLVSPLVWLLNTPDRFDVFSVGVVLLQMAVRPLRQDVGLLSFNSEFRRVGYDLDLWRKRCRFGKEEFALLDADGAAGWELLKSLLQPRHDKDFIIWPSLGKSRPSAKAALGHRYLTGSDVSFIGLELPSFSSLSPRDLISNLDLDSFQAKISLLSEDVMSKFTVVSPLPEVSLKSLPRISLSKFSRKFSNLPTSILSRALLPSVSELFFSNSPRSTGPWFDIGWRQAIKFLGIVRPVAAASAFTLVTAWLILWLLRESAQTLYAIGETSIKVVGISGVVGMSLVALSRSLSPGSITRHFAVDNNSNFSSEAPGWRVDTGEQSANSMAEESGSTTADNMKRGPPQRLRELLLPQRTMVKSQSARSLAAGTSKRTERKLDASSLLESKQNPSERERSLAMKGLAEVVQTMELQLDSLESFIVSDGFSSEQRQEQIAQMEKLLTQRHSEPVTLRQKFRG